ncbi:MAG: EF-hand domain-containing protein [Betaproteobacteria bacterium]|nr:EF-hand domain-containing protein [Betaproteobacteria bacterium]
MQSIHRLMTLAVAGMLGVAASAAVEAAAPAADFKKYDRNGDGKISLKEYEAQGGTVEMFRHLDANGDNVLSHTEFVTKGAEPTPIAPASPESPEVPDPHDDRR